MKNVSVAELRQNYTRAGLSEAEAPHNPMELFQEWLSQAIASGILEPNGMTLATINEFGYPVARMVLLKGFDHRGFVFYTNYNSDKAQQLQANLQASLVFWWSELERQVRIEGKVSKITPAESDAYFFSRPRGSQLGAWVSNQSQIIASREVLEKELEALEIKYQSQKIPRPEHWGGMRLAPVRIEFWQGRPNRLHDRLRYRLVSGEQWLRERLAP
ncbi:pyridoxamine 5'-phosphate oxidase [Gloeocapsa sp. PCC 73106]|uniref:pyridoxamine 5'-phosphate oxidase n=1 Tax=Gloeocapsa sp. PCC 73106 TaxID=102232 RepID=UPI0002AC13D7|nr:pyridoxamine 5'-phosphate oxidase [Gloeocapsa sp. PCC 73106]ELR97864.1 Pyridoxamine 5'-phosphate oxidase [Gloeocapsa sp. PCC 73106]